MATELKTCPFCGGEAVLCKGNEISYVQCTKCGCRTDTYYGIKHAVNTWNRRKEDEE